MTARLSLHHKLRFTLRTLLFSKRLVVLPFAVFATMLYAMIKNLFALDMSFEL
jgi:hypothetical protein